MGNKHTNKINTQYLQLEINYFNKLLSLKNSQLLEHFAIYEARLKLNRLCIISTNDLSFQYTHL